MLDYFKDASKTSENRKRTGQEYTDTVKIVRAKLDQ